MFKRALICSLILCSVNAQSGLSKEFVANQCDDLSHVIISISEKQNKKRCIDKLYRASLQLDTAAVLIIDDESNAAKELLNHAVANLYHAELLSCKQYIQITHSKTEAQKIRVLL